MHANHAKSRFTHHVMHALKHAHDKHARVKHAYAVHALAVRKF
jgi:hypothetical protein